MSIETIFGVIRPDGTLELEGKLKAAPGRVLLRVASIGPAFEQESLVEFGKRSRHEREMAGCSFRTKEEIDAEIAEMRNEWE